MMRQTETETDRQTDRNRDLPEHYETQRERFAPNIITERQTDRQTDREREICPKHYARERVSVKSDTS